jgi:hypothetical protein
VPANAVPRFQPSVYGFRFPNTWPSNAARVATLGPIRIPIGDTGRGLCGGMVFAARDRWLRDEAPPMIGVPPSPGEALFDEIVDRQFASFGPWFTVPLRFWSAAVSSQAARDRTTALDAWPAIKREIDAGSPSMVGLIRVSGWNPLAIGLGHQVVAYRYDESAEKVTIWIYDPNYPANDDARVSFERHPDGSLAYEQVPTEPLIGLLALPYEPPRT